MYYNTVRANVCRRVINPWAWACKMRSNFTPRRYVDEHLLLFRLWNLAPTMTTRLYFFKTHLKIGYYVMGFRIDFQSFSEGSPQCCFPSKSDEDPMQRLLCNWPRRTQQTLTCTPETTCSSQCICCGTPPALGDLASDRGARAWMSTQSARGKRSKEAYPSHPKHVLTKHPFAERSNNQADHEFKILSSGWLSHHDKSSVAHFLICCGCHRKSCHVNFFLTWCLSSLLGITWYALLLLI